MRKVLRNIVACILIISVVMTTLATKVYVYAADSVTPGNMINIKVEGDDLSGTKMKLTDASGNVVASWEKVKSNIVYSNAINKPDSSGFDCDIYSIFGFKASDDVIGMSYKNSYTSWNKIFGTSLKLHYNTTYELKANLAKKEDTMVVPAGKQIICIGEEWAKKAVEVEMWFPDHEYSNISLNDNAGKQLVYTETSRKLNCAYERITGGIIRLDNAEKDVLYDKVTINLNEAFISPDCFNEKGQYVTDEHGTVDFSKEDTVTPVYGVMAISSGSVLNIVVPDENGCVEAYISREANRADINLNFRYGSVMVDASPVLMRVDRGYNITKTIKSVELPSTGVNVVNLKAGNYKLVEMLSTGETVASKTISVANSNQIQKFTYTAIGMTDTDDSGENATTKETQADAEAETPRQEDDATEGVSGTNSEGETSNDEAVGDETTDSGVTESGTTESETNQGGTTENGTAQGGATESGATETTVSESGEVVSEASTESDLVQDVDNSGSEGGNNWWWLWLLILLICGSVGGWLGYRRYSNNKDKETEKGQ